MYERQKQYFKTEKGRRALAEAGRRYRKSLHQRAIAVVAKKWGDKNPRCRYDTLPAGNPIRSHECFGELQIDHMNGHGRRELVGFGVKFYRDIVGGKRTTDDLRVLCVLHQLWNWQPR